MTFADQYADHAYADLIREAETQGIGIGASQERERIIALLWDWGMANLDCQSQYEDLVALIGGQQANPHYELPEDLQEALDRITIRKKPE
jgi:hypothetical protein